MTQNDAEPARARSVYFVNAPVDFAVIGGVSLVAAAAFWMLDLSGKEVSAGRAAIALAWIVNWPHFSATSYRLYRSRSNVAQYPFTAIAIPLLMAAAVAAAFLSPDRIAPALVKLFILWSPFHFSGQTLGLTLLYARRAGMKIGRLDRAAFAGFIFATYVHLIVSQELDSIPAFFGGVRYPRLGLPEWMAFATQGAMHTYGLLMAGLFARACLGARRVLPLIILLPSLAQYVWFMAGARLPEFNLFIPLFHSLQYLLIAWSLQLKERMDESGAAPSPRFVFRESGAWALANVAGGAVLFFLLPRLALLAGVPILLSEPVFNAAIQIHHFFVDGVIWKLRNPAVGNPLLVAWEDLVRPAPAGGTA